MKVGSFFHRGQILYIQYLSGNPGRVKSWTYLLIVFHVNSVHRVSVVLVLLTVTVIVVGTVFVYLCAPLLTKAITKLTLRFINIWLKVMTRGVTPFGSFTKKLIAGEFIIILI